ncbi:MAG: hypothetical protein H6P96_1239 [Candidatus Aminicenantes bacterium]|nr:hypothetical protein [Candidatus Aminicenantes bacterium]
MKRTAYLSLALLVLAGAGAALVLAPGRGDGDIPADVVSLFKKNCVRCHTGPKPPKGLSLIPAKIASAIEAPSAEVPEAKLIVPSRASSDPRPHFSWKRTVTVKTIGTGLPSCRNGS